MRDRFGFADRLNKYVTRSAYTPGQLSSLSGLPKSTIVNWLEGRVARPRGWQSLLQLLAVLRLSEQEADEILQAAGKPPVVELRRLATGEEAKLLASWPRPRATQAPPFQAIPDPPTFVGREQALQQLAAWLQAGEMCVIQGLPGVGKTALAARLAYRLRDQLADGVLWARLTASEPAAILGTFARAYGVDVSDLPDVDSRSRVVRELLADKRALVVLDDVPESRLLEPLLPPTGRCAVLITTRRRNLRAAMGARHFTLEPFAAGEDSARRLFARILGEERVVAEASLFAQIATLLGRLPLALLLVASRLAYEPGWSTAALLSRLLQQHRRLEELAYEDLSVRLSFSLSLEELTPAERNFFALLSLFPGEEFAVEAAAAVAGSERERAEDIVRALHARSLIQASRQGRYSLHPLLRDYGREVLRGEGEQGAEAVGQRRLIAYYRRFLRREAGRLTPAHIQAIAVEQENILGAMEAAWSLGERTTYAAMLLDLFPYLSQRGFLELAEEKLLQVLPALTGEQAASCRLRLAEIARYRRHYQEAESQLEEMAVSLSTLLPALQAGLLTERGAIAACRDDYLQALALFAEALPFARQSDKPELLVSLLKEWGATEVALSRYEAAATRYAEALQLAREDVPGQVPVLLRALGGLAVARARDYEQARAHYLAALAAAREYEAHPALPILLNNLAVTAAAADGLAEAEAGLGEALTLARQGGSQVSLVAILFNQGALALQRGERERAARKLQAALEQAEAIAHAAFAERARDALAYLAGGQPGAPPQLLIIFD